jgi:hypothetical protein
VSIPAKLQRGSNDRVLRTDEGSISADQRWLAALFDGGPREMFERRGDSQGAFDPDLTMSRTPLRCAAGLCAKRRRSGEIRDPISHHSGPGRIA